MRGEAEHISSDKDTDIDLSNGIINEAFGNQNDEFRSVHDLADFYVDDTEC